VTALLWLAASLPVLYWDQDQDTAARLKQAGVARIAVPPALQSAWKGQADFEVQAADLQSATELLTPGVQYRVNQASATRSPWIDTNGWRYLRNPLGRYYYDAAGMSAPIAAAEAFMYGVGASVKTDAGGLEPLARMLDFLSRFKPAEMPLVADIAFMDDGSDEAGEVMNLMTRKNLLFRVVPKPDSRAKLTVRFGSGKYPKDESADPTEVAQKIRYELTDDRRSLRIFGSEVVLGRLAGDRRRMRVHLLNYAAASRPLNGIRVRVLGRFSRQSVRVPGSPDLAAVDVAVTREATEFTLPELKSFAVVDLEP
jgi:hypothetical protein